MSDFLPESTNLDEAQAERGRLSEIETKRASDMLDLFAPLSISSTWEPSERRTIIRAMLAYGDIVAGITNTERDAAAKPVQITPDLLGEVMQDAWGEICDDALAHPSDMRHGRGTQLSYSPNHWTTLIALRLTDRLGS